MLWAAAFLPAGDKSCVSWKMGEGRWCPWGGGTGGRRKDRGTEEGERVGRMRGRGNRGKEGGKEG